MSDPKLDLLAMSARNRGLKLVRSKVRSPAKPRFGKAGLKDASGKIVFGIDAKGPMASLNAIEGFLRELETKDWQASLGAETKRSKKTKSKRERKNDGAREQTAPSRLVPGPAATLQIRSARRSDAHRLAELIAQLEHPIDAETVRKNLKKLKALSETPLVASLGEKVVGLAGFHQTITLHRSTPLGRITILIVDAQVRGRGIGRMLTQAVEDKCREEGCAMIEVTSNDRRSEAHAFYRHLGYERTSLRFAKAL